MKNRKYLLLFFAFAAVFSLSISCSTAPQPVDPPVDPPLEPVPEDPDLQPPDQDALNRLNAAMARAESAREQALEVRGQTYFPGEWAKAESDYEAGKRAGRDTVRGVNEAIAWFTAAANGYEAIAENSGSLYEQDLEDTRAALEEAAARAGQSRNDALNNQGPVYFPEDWEAAEALLHSGEEANTDTLEEMKAAIALLTAAADSYDDIAERSRPLFAEEKNEAMAALQAAIARADESRKNAQDAQAPTLLANEWRAAEAGLQAGRNAKRDTIEEINAAQALFAAAADMYDDLAGRSRPLFEKNEAQKALDAAIARADRSRQQATAVDGQTYFANEWRAAESRLQSGRSARKNTAEEIRAAASLFVAAADAYDDIARRAGPRFNQDKDEANRALQAAIARAQQSRTQASNANGQANFPAEWRNAEARNQTATNARRGTTAEMRAAVPLYNQAADAYDDIVRKNTARLAEEEAARRAAEAARLAEEEAARRAAEAARLAEEAARLAAENQAAMEEAKDRADRERQAAIDAMAHIAVQDDFNRAETIYQQAMTDFNAKTYASAIDRFNQSSPLFTAAAEAARLKRNQAEDAVARAKERSAESIAYATNIGHILEEENFE